MRMHPQGGMKCDERARLLGVFNKATLAISTAVDNLLYGPGAASSVIYDMRRHTVEKARIGLDLASVAYDAHIDQHHCGPAGALAQNYRNN
jgi:hypothetical protein